MMHSMRTTLDIPDPVFRELKAKAALEGTTLKALLHQLLESGLRSPPKKAAPLPQAESEPPSIKLGRRLKLARPSNARLFELLDE
jgi:hypothetical protein